MIPAMNATRQAQSALSGARRPPTIPLIPAILPFVTQRIAADRPIRAPPATAEKGVKFSISDGRRPACAFFRAEHPIKLRQDRENALRGDPIEDGRTLASRA